MIPGAMGELQRTNRGPGGALVPATAPPSTANLVREAVSDAVELLQAHVQLATLEIREDAKMAGRIAVGFALGAALALLVVAFLAAAAAFALAAVLPTWAAFAIVGAAIAVLAAITVAVARRRAAVHDFTPERSLALLREEQR